MVVETKLVKENFLTTFDSMAKRPGKSRVDQPLSVRLDEDQVVSIDRLAANDRVSRAGMIRKLVDEAIRLRQTAGTSSAVRNEHLEPSADDPRDWHSILMDVVAYGPAGEGREPEPVTTGEQVEVEGDIARPALRKHMKVIKILGDSMEPRYLDGDHVLIEPGVKAKDKDFVFVLLNGSPQVKQIRIDRKTQRMVLVPRNPDHAPIPIFEGDELQLVGVVRDLVKRRGH